MSNPFEVIDQRLSNIETLLLGIKHSPKSNNPKETDELMTRKEASKFLKICLPNLDELTRTGILPASRIGTRVRYLKSDIVNALPKIKSANVA